ncbi:MAG: ESPR domain-containing protein, partial [Comamonas sp.]|nr:ESPR domain-containing protein [Comamonas sp.]
MNKHLHRIIFNAARGQRMVVSEVASSHGCGGAAGKVPCSTSALGGINLRLSAIAWGIAALGISAVCMP